MGVDKNWRDRGRTYCHIVREVQSQTMQPLEFERKADPNQLLLVHRDWLLSCWYDWWHWWPGFGQMWYWNNHHGDCRTQQALQFARIGGLEDQKLYNFLNWSSDSFLLRCVVVLVLERTVWRWLKVLRGWKIAAFSVLSSRFSSKWRAWCLERR